MQTHEVQCRTSRGINDNNKVQCRSARTEKRVNDRAAREQLTTEYKYRNKHGMPKISANDRMRTESDKSEHDRYAESGPIMDKCVYDNTATQSECEQTKTERECMK